LKDGQAKKTVRIGAGQGFYGDTIAPAVMIAEHGNVDYICFDALAELTLAILQKDRQKDPRAGYTKDIAISFRLLLPYVKNKGIKLITNAGGMNPLGAVEEIKRIAAELGIRGLRIGVATGDDLLAELPRLREQGVPFTHLNTGAPFDEVKDRLLFANAYIGAQPIVEALRQGADIVVTGRTADCAQFMAPLIHEFGWRWDDWDRLAQAAILGHIMECSGQAAGGNFSGDWWNLERMEVPAFPIAEVEPDGTAVLTKLPMSGGRVSFDTVKEQMLYEVHDPRRYITPDVIADFTSTVVEDIGADQVRVSGTKGEPRPAQLKLVAGYQDGYMGQAIVGFSWPEARLKAKRMEAIIRKQVQLLRLKVENLRFDYLGYNSAFGGEPEIPDNANEVWVRIAAWSRDKAEANRIGRLIPPLGLNGPPHILGLGGVSGARELIGVWPTLVPREYVEPRITVQVEEV
jgi:hypothetical protein